MNRALPILAAAFLLTGCPLEGTKPGGPFDDMQPGTNLELTRITPGGAPVYVSGLAEPAQTAVFDAATFSDLWNRAFAGGDPMPVLPEVDFAREFVLVAALGERTTGGYVVQVTKAIAGGSTVIAEVETTAPGKNCPVPLSLTQPLDIVKLERPSPGVVTVRFEGKLVTHDCTQ